MCQDWLSGTLREVAEQRARRKLHAAGQDQEREVVQVALAAQEVRLCVGVAAAGREAPLVVER